jgi:hypothetical protein
MKRGVLLAGAVLLWAAPAFAQSNPKKAKRPPVPRTGERRSPPPRQTGEGADLVPKPDPLPQDLERQAAKPAPILRWMLQPLKRGMWIRLPIIDTNPNRGITVGVMPIWVLKEDGGDRIRQIHAPSLTYNKHFVVTPTYRYYLYPQDDAALMTRASAGKYEHEVVGQYEDRSIFGSPYAVGLRVQYSVDGGSRFYGVGPDTHKTAETNYKAGFFLVKTSWGLPVFKVHGWRAHVGDRYLAQKVGNGPIPGLPGFESRFPQFAAQRRHQSNEVRLTLDYDTRDHQTTTTEGAYLQLYNEQSVRGFLSEYDFGRRGVDGRYFFKWGERRRRVTAVQASFEQLNGRAPFWLMPSLGGKYSLRAYGEGRFIDRSVAAVNVEQRLTLFDARFAGVTTDFELAPFAGIGTVADQPGRYSARYARPVVGAAVRVIARPQVVGSVDFGVGQEGLTVFMDINYSF